MDPIGINSSGGGKKKTIKNVILISEYQYWCDDKFKVLSNNDFFSFLHVNKKNTKVYNQGHNSHAQKL